MDFASYPQIVGGLVPAGSERSGIYPETAMSNPPEPRDALRPGWLETPHPSRFSVEAAGFPEAMAAHDEAVEAGQSGYLDPGSGLFVMTAVYLHDRGWCCDCGCRHCPYLA